MKVSFEDLRSPLYLMPLTAVSALLFHMLKSHDIAVAGFLDNDEKLHGKKYNGCTIISPDKSGSLSCDSTVILCTQKYRDSHDEQMRTLGITNIVPLEQIPLTMDDARAAISQINRDNLHELSPNQAQRLPTRALREMRSYLLPESALECDSLILDSVEIVLTEKCTLKCKACANLMQYFKTPRHSNLGEMCRDIDVLTKNVDFIRRFKLLGGEPLLFNQLPELISHIIKHQDKIGSVSLITNGTIIPSEDVLNALKNAEIIVLISDYGKTSTKLEKLIRVLSEKQIEYQIPNIRWCDIQRIVANDTENTQPKFEQCITICTTIKNGCFYRCPFLANGDTLKAFPQDKSNQVLLDESCTKEAIRNYLSGAVTPLGCGYCCGYPADAPEMPLAEQIKEPLEYRSF